MCACSLFDLLSLLPLFLSHRSTAFAISFLLILIFISFYSFFSVSASYLRDFFCCCFSLFVLWVLARFFLLLFLFLFFLFSFRLAVVGSICHLLFVCKFSALWLLSQSHLITFMLPRKFVEFPPSPLSLRVMVRKPQWCQRMCNIHIFMYIRT